MHEKPTVVIGASPNPQRYSYLATNMLREYGHEVYPLGIRQGQIGELKIITNWPEHLNEIDTVSLYIGPDHQPDHYAYIIGLKPKRVIFNPGTENHEFAALLSLKGIETLEACTLVLLRTNQY